MKSYHKKVRYTCQICGDQFQAWESDHTVTCSKACLAEKNTLNLIEKYSTKVGEPIEQWMRRKYLTEFWSYRQMCNALGISHVHALMKLLKRFGIEPRRGTEAIHAQWIHRGKMTTEERKQRDLEKLKFYRAKWPEKAGARNAVSRAIKKGNLPPLKDCICAKCGGPASGYHHHKGYAPECWLDVIPVCNKCHHHLDND